MRRAVAVGALAVLVALAGCSGGVSPGGSDTDTPTLTPVAVPETGTAAGRTATATSAGDRLAPGLTDAGVADPFALADAHRRTLSNRSYTVTSRTRIVGENGTLRTVDRTLTVAPGGRRYHLIERSDSAPAYPVQSVAARIEVWYAGEPALFRVGTENVSYRAGTTVSIGGPVGDLTGHDRLVGLYGGVDRWAVDTRVGWRNAFFTLESRSHPDAGVLDVPLLLEAPHDVRIRFALYSDGRVDNYQVRYGATFDGRPVEVVRRVHYGEVGNTTVAEPGWLDEARDATSGPTAERDAKEPLNGGE